MKLGILLIALGALPQIPIAAASAVNGSPTSVPAATPNAGQMLMNPNMANLASNGASRGGGNGVVCFADKKYAQALTHTDPNTGQTSYLPLSSQKTPEAFHNISSIEMTDFFSMPQTSKDFITNVIESKFPEKDQLNDAYQWMIGRLSGIKTAHADLDAASVTLSLSNATPMPAGVTQLPDTPLVGNIPDNCILTTMFVQVSSGISTLWYYNPEIFNHPKHSRTSQAVTLLHERVYSLARSKLTPDTSSDLTMVFVHRLLNPATDYAFLIDAYNKVKPYFGLATRDRDLNGTDVPGSSTLTGIWSSLEGIAGPSTVSWMKNNQCMTIDPNSLRQMQQLYQSQLQPQLYADPYIASELKRSFDEDVLIYLGLKDASQREESTGPNSTHPLATSSLCYIDIALWTDELAIRYEVPFDGPTPITRLSDDDLRGIQ